MNWLRSVIGALLLCYLAGCAASSANYGPMSDVRVSGPSGYTVDWDLPETDYFWVPKVSEDDLKPASVACKVGLETFVYHHLPRPPQYSYIGFRFPADATDMSKTCILERLGAVQALTVYPKKK